MPLPFAISILIFAALAVFGFVACRNFGFSQQRVESDARMKMDFAQHLYCAVEEASVKARRVAPQAIKDLTALKCQNQRCETAPTRANSPASPQRT